MADFFSDYGIIVSFFVGLTVLGGFIYKTVAGYKKQQNDKEDKALKQLEKKEADRLKDQEIKEAIVKKDMETKDALVKIDMERRAEQLRKDTESLANTVRGTAEDKASIIKEEISMTARLLKEHNATSIEQVLARIKDVDDKVMRMLNDLTKRADLTNGSVKAIRDEIQTVNEQVEDIWSRLEEESAVTAAPQLSSTESLKHQSMVARRQRQQAVMRRKKRAAINADSMSQHSAKEDY